MRSPACERNKGSPEVVHSPPGLIFGTLQYEVFFDIDEDEVTDCIHGHVINDKRLLEYHV